MSITARTVAIIVLLGLLASAATACAGPGSDAVVQAANSTTILTPPANVIAVNSPKGHVIVRWDADDAPVHRVGWANAADVIEAQAAGDWMDALHFADTKRPTDYTIKHLPAGHDYFFIVGAAQRRFADATWGEWTRLRVTAAQTEPTSPPAPTPTPPAGKVWALAPIESVEIIVAESWPPQYFVHVVAGLPNGCVEFYGYDETRSGNVITITVTNLEPAPSEPVACAAIYRTHEFSVPLGTDFEPGETYTVRVNDVTETMVAQ